MDDQERQAEQDDFEVEITDLDQSPDRGRLAWPRLTPRQRRASLVATIALFVLIVVFLLSSSANGGSLLGEFAPLSTSTPLPSVEAGRLAVYLNGNPTWGHFTLDGKALPAQLPGKGKPLELARGAHTIVWQVEPFRSKTCVFTVIDEISATGPCFLNGIATIGSDPDLKADIMTFFASLADMPAEQRASLEQQLQARFAAYTSSTQVQPGELYAVSEQEALSHPELCKPFESLALCYARATQPLLATLSMQVDNSTASDDPCSVSGQCMNNEDCRMLCSGTFAYYSPPTMNGWNVLAMVRLLWSYRALSGQTIASAQPNSALRGSQLYQEVAVNIERSASNNWHFTLFQNYNPPDFSANPLCNQAMDDTMSILNASFDNNSNMYVGEATLNPARMAAGCLTIANMQPSLQALTPTPTSIQGMTLPASFLLRFGVLLAANASAHKFCPNLPIADAVEARLAQSLQATLNGSA